MGVGAKLSLGLGRLLELAGRGAWCESQNRHRAFYFILFGPEAELTAWLLPTATELSAAASDNKNPPSFVIITDRLATARLAEDRGHFAVYFNIEHLGQRAATWWLKNILRVQFAQFQPEAVFFSPYFFPRLPRPRHLAQALAGMLKRFARDPRPHMLINELETDYKQPMIGLYELWKAGKYREPASVHYFGDPAYLDVSSLFADKDYMHVETLGWRVAQPPPQAPPENLFYLWLNNPLVTREVRLALADGSNGKNGHTAPPPEIITPQSAKLNIAGMLEQIANRPGIVLADTFAPLLPLLSMNAPVALLRGPSMSSQIGLVKYSFFAANGPDQARWPILAGSHEISNILSNGGAIPWWQTWSTRRTPLEAATSTNCAAQFIDRIYKPTLTKN